MDPFFLIGVSFLTSTFTAIIGVGGGIALISVMPGLLPTAAIIPVHGAVQLASNASRVFFGLRHIEWRIFWPFAGGSLLGAVVGAQAVGDFSFDDLPLYLGVFILLVIWVPVPSRAFRLPGHFAIFGALQTFLALFVGVAGPLTGAFLASAGLPKDRLGHYPRHGNDRHPSMQNLGLRLCRLLLRALLATHRRDDWRGRAWLVVRDALARPGF